MKIASAAAPAAASSARLSDIDMFRGLVVVLMALDHVRDYFHVGGFRIDPLDPAQTTPLLYLTRWITHLCAPAFVFLAGVSAYLQLQNGKTARALSSFLVKRGLWLIAMEITVLSFGWSFGFPYPFFLQVIWAIGWGMIALAALVLLPRVGVLAIGLLIVFGHNLLDPITSEQFGAAAQFWTYFHGGGPIFLGDMPIGVFAYPVLPWIGVMAVGFGAGPLLAESAETRDRKLLLIGAGMLALFVLLRWTGLYGEPPAESGWRDQSSAGATLMTFFNVQKYPPSFLFLLVTLGLSALLMPVLSRLKGLSATVLLTFGAVPFFFYILHIYLVHALAIAANAIAGRPVSGLFNYLINAFTAPEKLDGVGFSLPIVYLAWIGVIVILFPACRWFQGVKRRGKDWWMSYI